MTAWILSSPLRALLSATALLVLPARVHATLQSPGVRPVQHREYPLNCRGGGQLVFDTLSPPSDTATGRLLRDAFGANSTASAR